MRQNLLFTFEYEIELIVDSLITLTFIDQDIKVLQLEDSSNLLDRKMPFTFEILNSSVRFTGIN